MTRGSTIASGVSDLDALVALAQLRDAQHEVLRLQSQVTDVAERLLLTGRGVLWSGSAAAAWRETMGELHRDSSRGADALGELHRLLEAVVVSIEQDWSQ